MPAAGSGERAGPHGWAAKALRGGGKGLPGPRNPKPVCKLGLAPTPSFPECRRKPYRIPKQPKSHPQTHPLLTVLCSEYGRRCTASTVPRKERATAGNEPTELGASQGGGVNVGFPIGYVNCQSKFISRESLISPPFLSVYWLPTVKALGSCERQMGTKSEAS